VLDFNLKLGTREAQQLFPFDKFDFSRNFRRARLPTQFVEIQNVTLNTRSAATFESERLREKQTCQFQSILSGASDLSFPTRNAERRR